MTPNPPERDPSLVKKYTRFLARISEIIEDTPQVSNAFNTLNSDKFRQEAEREFGITIPADFDLTRVTYNASADQVVTVTSFGQRTEEPELEPDVKGVLVFANYSEEEVIITIKPGEIEINSPQGSQRIVDFLQSPEN